MKKRKLISYLLVACIVASLCSFAAADDLKNVTQAAVQENTQLSQFNLDVFRNSSTYNITTSQDGQTVITLKDMAIGIWTDNDTNTLDVYPRIVGGNNSPYIFQLAACYSGGPIGAQNFTILTPNRAYSFVPTTSVSVVNNVATELLTVNLATEQTLQLVLDLANAQGSITYTLQGSTRYISGSFVILNSSALTNMYNDYVNNNGLKQDLTAAAALNLSSVYEIVFTVEPNTSHKTKTTYQSYNNNYPYYYYYSGYNTDVWAANNLNDSEYLAYQYACGNITDDDIEEWYNKGLLSREDCIAINGYLGYNAFADPSLDRDYSGQTAAGAAHIDREYEKWLASQNNNYYNQYSIVNPPHDGQNEYDRQMIDNAYNRWLIETSGQTEEDVRRIDEDYYNWVAENSGQTEEDLRMIDEDYYNWVAENSGQTEEDLRMIDEDYLNWLATQDDSAN